jgi:hypothetical protein
VKSFSGFGGNTPQGRSIDGAGFNASRYGLAESYCFNSETRYLPGSRPVEFPYYASPSLEHVPSWARPKEIFTLRVLY